MSIFSRAAHVAWVAPLTLCITLPVSAQVLDDGATLEEIVVTARKREENLQDVPIAVTAITADTLQREGIKDIEGIIDRDPSLSFDRGIAPYDTRLVIRGLSPTRGRPNVATLVDGIDVSSEAIGVAGGSLLINPRLVDIERIEIVKGPQSALYGRSAFAGAISYITADPDKEVSGSTSAEFNEHDAFDVKGNVSLPISDTLGIRVNAYKFDDRGAYRNSIGGEHVGGGDGLGGSLTLKWAPTDSYSLKLRAEFADDHFDQPAQANVAFNTVSIVPAAASSCRAYSIANPAGGTLVATGPVLDASCQFVDANAALPANTPNLARTFQTATLGAAPTTITPDMVFDDMNVPAYRGPMVRGDRLAVTYNPDFTRSRDNGLTGPAFSGTDRDVTRFSAVQELNVAFGTFASLTGYTQAEVGTELDFDKTARSIIQQTIKTSSPTKQVSQELRFTSDFDGSLQFITGYQYWTERADQSDRNNTVFGAGTSCPLLSIPFPPPGRLLCATQASPVGRAYTETSVSSYMDDVAAARQVSLVRRSVDHQSLYLELEWDVMDTLRLIGEARYIDEDNKVDGPVTAGNQGPGVVILCGATGDCRTAAAIPYAPQPGLPATFAGAAQISRKTLTRNDSYLTPKATVQWRPTDDLNFYGSYSVGKKPGGFGTLTIGAFGLASREDVEFEPEQIKVYELGAKWTSPARNVQLSAAAFVQDFTDKQVTTQIIIGNTLGNRIANAGGAELQGLELSGLWRASTYLTVGFGLTHFLKYEFTDYTTLSAGAAEIARTGNCTPVTTVIVTASVNQAKTTCAVSRTGNKLEDTPETAAALNLGYRRPYGSDGNYWFADADVSYVGERFIEDDNTIWLEAYTNLNLRLGLGNDSWSATLFVDNATDDDKVRSAGTGPGTAVADARAAPRIGTAGALPVNLTNPVAAFGLAIPTSVFAEMPRPRTIGLRVSYKF
jgi:outer membrane receptor protein involved in Fe transport